MVTLGLTGRIWVCVEPVDGRKSFDGLAAVVTAQLGRDPLSGDLFVFKNRRGDRLKILAWQGDGFALYLRRLERGTFAFPKADAAGVSVTATELAMILGGVELKGVQRRPRYQRSLHHRGAESAEPKQTAVPSHG
jgi:transposase